MSARKVWLGLLVLGWVAASAACGRTDLAGSCASDDECRDGRTCAQGSCTEPGEIDDDPDMEPPVVCADVSACPGGGAPVGAGELCAVYSCTNSVCAVTSTVALTCDDDEVQLGCECVPGACSSQQECGDLACVDEQCVPCSTDAGCDDKVCSGGVCVQCNEDADCGAQERCEVAINACVPRPECVLDRECAADQICLNGRCARSPECVTDDDCDEEFECVGGRCFELVCRGASDCAPGKLCDAGACIDPPDAVARCIVATQSTTVAPGQQVVLEAFALDEAGGGVAASFTWSTSDA
ncbi:MAG: Dickkopf N-terminal cysteine-rich domain-containing protein, partial [Myxococcota bacterium]